MYCTGGIVTNKECCLGEKDCTLYIPLSLFKDKVVEISEDFFDEELIEKIKEMMNERVY